MVDNERDQSICGIRIQWLAGSENVGGGVTECRVFWHKNVLLSVSSAFDGCVFFFT